MTRHCLADEEKVKAATASVAWQLTAGRSGR